MKLVLPFSWDNLQIIQTILWFYHLSAYAHLPKSDSSDHCMYLVALPYCPELLQAVFGLPISHASPFPWDCTHQNTHVHHNQIQHDETQHLSNLKEKRVSEVSKLQVTLCPNGFPEPSSNSEMFYQDPHMLCLLPSCKSVFLVICYVLDAFLVSRLADAHNHRLMKEEQGAGGWKVFLDFM